MTSESGYRPLLANTRFQAFLWTQFLGAFNDNVYKMIVSVLAVRLAVGSDAGSRYLALAGAVFVIPFLLFAGYAGQLADRFSKTRVLQWTKAFEIVIMLLGVGALLSGRIEALLVVLFLLAVQANFFSPAKYSILPEILPESQLSRANGLLELSTFVAIVVGASFGTLLFERWQAEPVRIGLILLGIAGLGSFCSLHIQRVPAAGSTAPFRWNPFAEIAIGWRSLRSNQPLLLAVVGISWFWFVGALFQMALLLAGKEVLHVSETRVGLLVTALAAGIGVGSLLAGSLSGNRIELGLVPIGSGLMAICSAGFGWTHSFAPALAWLFGVGFAGGLFAVPLNAYLQERAPAEEKGRILATNNFVNMIGVISASGLLWLLHDYLHWSPGTILVALGAVMLAGTAILLLRAPVPALRLCAGLIARCLFRVRIEGQEHIPAHGAALLAANHISYADGVLLAMTTDRNIRFLVWAQLYRIPLLRHAFDLIGAIPVASRSPMAIQRARDCLERGELVGIFPEGRLTPDGEVGAFERGFTRIQQGTAAPIIPIHIGGLYGHPLTRSRSLGWLSRPEVTVRIGEPLRSPVSPVELREIVAALGTEMQKEIDTWKSSLAC